MCACSKTLILKVQKSALSLNAHTPDFVHLRRLSRSCQACDNRCQIPSVKPQPAVRAWRAELKTSLARKAQARPSLQLRCSSVISGGVTIYCRANLENRRFIVFIDYTAADFRAFFLGHIFSSGSHRRRSPVSPPPPLREKPKQRLSARLEWLLLLRSDYVTVVR